VVPPPLFSPLNYSPPERHPFSPPFFFRSNRSFRKGFLYLVSIGRPRFLPWPHPGSDLFPRFASSSICHLEFDPDLIPVDGPSTPTHIPLPFTVLIPTRVSRGRSLFSDGPLLFIKKVVFFLRSTPRNWRFCDSWGRQDVRTFRPSDGLASPSNLRLLPTSPLCSESSAIFGVFFKSMHRSKMTFPPPLSR